MFERARSPLREESAHGQDVGFEPDRRVRTASTIKLPIFCALESLVAAGTVTWDERVRLRAADKVSGSGIVADLEDGTELCSVTSRR